MEQGNSPAPAEALLDNAAKEARVLSCLRDLCAHGYGKLVVLVHAGQIRAIEPSPKILYEK